MGFLPHFENLVIVCLLVITLLELKGLSNKMSTSNVTLSQAVTDLTTALTNETAAITAEQTAITNAIAALGNTNPTPAQQDLINQIEAAAQNIGTSTTNITSSTSALTAAIPAAAPTDNPTS